MNLNLPTSHKPKYTKEELKKCPKPYIRVCTVADVKIGLFFRPFAIVLMFQGIRKLPWYIFCATYVVQRRSNNNSEEFNNEKIGKEILLL